MNQVQLAGLFFLATEEFNSSNCMTARVVLKEKINFGNLYPSYRDLIVDNPLLQTKIIEQIPKNKFCWGRFTGDEIKRFLDFERCQLASKYSKETVLRQYYPTNTRLPFYITVIDDFTVVVSMNHAIANGRCFVFWIQKWLQYYAKDHTSARKHTKGKDFVGKFSPMLKMGKSFLWLPFFLARFFMRTRKINPKDTIDLSHGKMPEKNQDYFTKSYSLDRESTKKLLQRSKHAGMTLTEYMCMVLVRAIFHSNPGKRRLFMSLPMDLQSLQPYSPEHTYGNMIASLPAQFFSGSDVEKQVKSAFKWIKRGVPYSLSWLFATLSISYAKSRAKCLELSKKPISERFPLWDFSLTYSNLGVISFPVMEKLVDSIFFYFKSQSIFLATSTISGKLCMELSFSLDLYQPDEVVELFDWILSEDNLMK